MIKFTVPGPMISTNAAYRKRGAGFGMFMTPEGKAWKTAIALMAKVAMRGKPMFAAPVYVNVVYYRPSKRGDVDGPGKLLLDSLESICFENDSIVHLFTQLKDCDPKKPRTDVTVGEI
jgi:Holliday junction resolvase RusA-like endonuclease